MYEVEQKYRVSEPQPTIDALTQLGAKPGDVVQQADIYFAHPSRNFRQTDEALRIRTIDDGGSVRHRLTYKGPKIDATTKTRKEIELDVPDNDSEKLALLLGSLGFEPAVAVKKERQCFDLQFRQHQIEIAVDKVQQLGHFVELEITVDVDGLEEAKVAIGELAAKLGLKQTERRGYADLIDEFDN